MSFNEDDARALAAAASQNIVTHAIRLPDNQHYLVRIDLGEVTARDAVPLLGDALMAAARSFNSGDTTVWLDITTSEVPHFVCEAFTYCSGFGLALVVTHGRKCSHRPGGRLPAPILEAMGKAQRSGLVWHPHIEQFVQSDVLNDDESITVQSDGELSIALAADGSVCTTSDGNIICKIEHIKSVGIKNLVDIEHHVINRIFDSVSHHVKFFGGGELRFAFNKQGELIELKAIKLITTVLNGNELLFDVQS